QLTDVTEFDIGHIIRNRRVIECRAQHFRRRHEQEFRFAVDESRDQPRARDAVDLGPLTSYPFHASPPQAVRRVRKELLILLLYSSIYYMSDAPTWLML